MSARGWQFWIDRGGTFTDILARHPDGRLTSRKLLSDNPGQYQDAAVAGILSVLADSSGKPHIEAIKMGTTVATNALLERRGEPTALLITAGFKDALRIAYQDRPDLFALDIRRPEMLYQEVLAVEERLAADGRCLQALNQEQLRSDLEAAYARGLRAVSICFLHAYRYPRHEQIAAEIAAETGFTQVSVSHLTSPLIKFISRADTTLADAYLSPVLQAYIEKLQAALTVAGVQAERLLFMQSNGGLVAPTDFQGKDSVLSGPAGGVVGMVSACAGIGEQRLIGFDMGGTSTDVSLYAGEFERVTETEIAGVRLRAPMIRIHTIAAGGGSILKFSAGRFQVGPESAGAQPGPRCYRNDGPLTVTDANLILGRLNATNFPAVFGPAGDQGPDAEAAQAGFEALAKKISQTSGKHWSPESVAEGFIRVAVDNMANAIKTVSIQRGYDPADFTLCCFGGAAGQQACRVADALGLQRVVIHPLAGLLSAYGIGMATLSSYAQASLDVALTETQVDILKAMREKLASEGQAKLSGQGIRQADMRVETTLAVRLEGTDTSLAIDWQDSLAETADAFRAAHLRRFGFAGSEDELRVDSMRVTVVGAQLDNATALPSAPTNTRQTPQQTRLFVDGRWASAELWQREQLSVETLLRGPALIVDETNTVVLEPGWQLQLDDQHRLVLTRCEQSTEAVISADADPVLLEVFNNHFVNIAEQMGAVLENTAHSVNIKERRDFSCALFDADGRLIANAPHIPVHLGSMGTSVQAVLASNAIQPGDSWLLNDPYHGGTHLPDITVVTPLFDQRGEEIRFLVACRAHHADVGGISPGSMPASSRHIDEEGLRCEPFPLVRDGQLRIDELRRRLGTGAHPARNPEQNIADLRAQLAANEKGLQQLQAMLEHFGEAAVTAYMRHVRANAEAAVRELFPGLQDGRGLAQLDSDEQVQVSISLSSDRQTLRIDFTGSSPQSPGNFNAPAGVTRAAVLYCLRCLIRQRIPLNDGCLAAVEICLPQPSLLSPLAPAAVAAGNVETSQCVANALLAAFGVQAASQGTMNNLSFGNQQYQYYETMGGGSGAGPGFAGADAVHTHMTNSRITDPEILELRYPVLLREFSIRPNSGGAGRWKGGNGLLRAIEFEQPMQAAIVSNHRRRGAPGLAGGGPGRPGANLLVKADGFVEQLPAVAEVAVAAGDMLVIATPGGGGYGPAKGKKS